jgi:hydroxylamine reductase
MYMVGTGRADFSALIQKAHEVKLWHREQKKASAYHVTGHHHSTLKTLVPLTAASIQGKELKRILFLLGSGESKPDQTYFTALAEAAPRDSMILAAGCAKNSLIHSLDNVVDGTDVVPRILDLGQIHDSYSGMVFLNELAKQLGCLELSDLPVSVAMTHADQTDTAILLALLSMGFQNIRLGPSRPDYVTPKAMGVLSKTHSILPTADPKDDLAAMMQGK